MIDFNERENIPSGLRAFVLYRDNYKCKYCRVTSLESKLHVDHIIPVSRGGGNNFGNLITACERCNIGKSNNFIAPRTPTIIDTIKYYMFKHVIVIDPDEYYAFKSIKSAIMDGTIIIPKEPKITARQPVDELDNDEQEQTKSCSYSCSDTLRRTNKEHVCNVFIITGVIGLIASLIAIMLGY